VAAKAQLLRQASAKRENADSSWDAYVLAVLAAHAGGCTMREIASAVGVSGTAIHKLIKSRR
jgi:predicted transcriptional regulator